MNTSILLKKQTTCEVIGGVAPNFLDHLEKTDPTFPRKIKLGSNKQSPVFYDAAEIEAWLESKKAARLPATNEAGV